MVTTTEDTTVVIIGAGVAGLTLGNFLLKSGIDCVVLEKQSRQYVENRQRAGTIDSRGVRMFREWGLEDVTKDKDAASEITGGIWIDEVMYPMDFDDDNISDSVLCPQQVLVRNLTDAFLRAGGDLRFEARDVTPQDLLGERALVHYRSTDGTAKAISCDFVAGCDGFHGISRASIPDDVLTRYSHVYTFSWLSILAEVPANPSGMAIHDRGLAGMIPRGANASRLYIQCPAGDTPEQWPDERIWSELQARFGTEVPPGRIVDKRIVPLRCEVFSPMSYGNLHLLGDAAHIVPPMSAKGIHLALFDTEVFARAVIKKVQEGDAGLLDSYSDTCLSHIWNYQAFAVWITELMHNAGDASYEGEFRKQLARAELERQFTSPAANRLFSELSAGLL
ncbi:4-hydroxybenzoate 3-monooxygenase [Streptomyces sp. PSAA01]|uniref:4-hydroxybenzoate 3-monooxygenase n=1 Tax=Streptomyces sp. PSAA01 TaxID=2912762 RepID=UPI001F0312F9|nr:4-hydroxybenzoate 3-monooxygenase [Streptomyces sp. PSAA01]MCG0285565.1 4-hydroxybenzoate 3-monooxygenase [Streptomyces sp. PSAA01]